MGRGADAWGGSCPLAGAAMGLDRSGCIASGTCQKLFKSQFLLCERSGVTPALGLIRVRRGL